MKNLFKLLIIACCLLPIACNAQFDFIGRKIYSNQPKPIPSKSIKSIQGNIPKLDFKFDSVRSLDEINTKTGTGFPWLSPDGNRIYYTVGKNESIDSNQLNIYFASKQNNEYKFSNPKQLSINSNDTFISTFFGWLTNDEKNIFFIGNRDTTYRNYLYKASRDSISEDFSTPVRISLTGRKINYLDCPSFTQDLNNLFITEDLDSNAIQIYRIYIYTKISDYVYTLSDSLKTPRWYFNINPGNLSVNGLKYFFSITYDYNTSGIFVFKRDTINENFSKLYYLNNIYINDTTIFYIGDPYLSIDNNNFLFAKDTNISWISSYLNIAYNLKEFDGIVEHELGKQNINIFPNPANNDLEIIPVDVYHSFEYSLNDLSGQLIKAGAFDSSIKLDLSSLSRGIYIIKIFDKNNKQTTYHKIVKI